METCPFSPAYYLFNHLFISVFIYEYLFYFGGFNNMTNIIIYFVGQTVPSLDIRVFFRLAPVSFRCIPSLIRHFPSLTLESAISPESAGFCYWRKACTKEDPELGMFIVTACRTTGRREPGSLDRHCPTCTFVSVFSVYYPYTGIQ